MSRFVQGADRRQPTLLPECLDDYVSENNPVRVVDVFVDELDLRGLDFDGMTPAATGRPAYHPAMLLKLYVYGYLNKVQSSRRLEREAQRNVELTGRLTRTSIAARPALCLRTHDRRREGHDAASILGSGQLHRL